MDFKMFFAPVSEEVVSIQAQRGSFYKNIRVFQETMPDYKDAHMALVGVGEERGTHINEGAAEAPDAIRKKLYALKKGNGAYKIVDLGNLRLGVDAEETRGRLREVCQFLIENNVLPVILGGSHDLDMGQYQAYEGMEKLISILNVDAFLDMEESKEFTDAQRHIHRILMHEPNFLFNYSQLGYQSYLIDQKYVDTLEKLYFEAYRIGHLRTNLTEMEPVIRNADMLTFDITAIKSSDAPGNAQAQPFGLTGEEACQICWYAGLNEKLSSIGFYEYNPRWDDDHSKTAAVVATMIWYFVEGYYHRKNEQDFRTNDYLTFVVSMPSEPEVIRFYKSKLSEKWWLEVPYPSSKDKFLRNCLVPCSYTDYQDALKGELPDRYINTLAKIS
jgi:formiminoglutamase